MQGNEKFPDLSIPIGEVPELTADGIFYLAADEIGGDRGVIPSAHIISKRATLIQKMRGKDTGEEKLLSEDDNQLWDDFKSYLNNSTEYTIQ
jgi:hypothetical protein